jgi:hypothetical protein
MLLEQREQLTSRFVRVCRWDYSRGIRLKLWTASALAALGKPRASRNRHKECYVQDVAANPNLT